MARRGRVRVIAGTVGGRHLAVPSDGTRPMTDRAREALFSALDARGRLRRAAVLDLFAGSGALGIEALSRGATSLVAVESDDDAATVLSSNIATVGFDRAAQVERGAVAQVLARRPPASAPFDLVFCDPPYAMPDLEVGDVLRRVAAGAWTSTDVGIVVHRRRLGPPIPPAWRIGWERSFGDTLLVLVEREPRNPHARR